MEAIYYNSTRGKDKQVSAARAILMGIAQDGGLFTPKAIPKLEVKLNELVDLDYHKLALHVLKYFLTNFEEQELSECVYRAYDEKFDTLEIAPITKHSGVYFLELFHGPTLAFKDMALSILPYLLRTAAHKLGVNKEIVILTATSGDTGKAALEGFSGVEGTKIIVFFPEHGVSEIQKRQMVTQDGDNAFVIGIEGNFDDAQSGVKKIFVDYPLRQKMAERDLIFSSANSINIGRLIPQVVYYFYAYLKLVAGGEIKVGEKINYVVPTGNFGNILAGYYAKKMGLPVHKLICASNENKVLYEFINTGIYNKKRNFVTTISPSMDILVSSNLERLLYHIHQGNTVMIREMMQKLNDGGKYTITEEMLTLLKEDFIGEYASEGETRKAIRDLFFNSGYMIDPHTAVAYLVYQKCCQEEGAGVRTVILSTASPYKFTKEVMCSVDKKYERMDDYELIKEMSQLTGEPIPPVIRDLAKKPILHRAVCQKEEMDLMLEKILGL